MRIAGIDYGTKRIGIAVAETAVGIAFPHSTCTRKSLSADRQFFNDLVAREEINLFVVGLPVHLDGNESQSSIAVREFGTWLCQQTGVPVEYFDERFSTVEAEQILDTAGLTSKQRLHRRDQLAAQIMLTAYLEASERGQDSLRSID